MYFLKISQFWADEWKYILWEYQYQFSISSVVCKLYNTSVPTQAITPGGFDALFSGHPVIHYDHPVMPSDSPVNSFKLPGSVPRPQVGLLGDPFSRISR